MTTSAPTISTVTTRGDRIDVPLADGERWWGGAVDDGGRMPIGKATYLRDLGVAEGHGTSSARPSNQMAPVLVSTRGRALTSARPFRIELGAGVLSVLGDEITLIETGGALRDAYLAASENAFPPTGSAPARELFTMPQYNTWIETPYTPTSGSVLAYARGILDAGLPSGVLMIDDSWGPDYGTFEFDRARFPDPEKMVETLRSLGFPVMLWVVPFISPDSAVFRELERHDLLLRDRDGEIAVRRWWNGLSALLDLTNPATIAWLTARLDALLEIGVAGFKFDAGDIRDYRTDDRAYAPASPVDFAEAWASIGLRYPFNEYRASWRMGGQPLAQRLQDKPPHWGATGIGSLIPEMLVQAMTGHAFTCPDMIGGGEISAVSGASEVDQEFFIRYAQLAAFAPMWQFSGSPARVLDGEHLDVLRGVVKLRSELLPELDALVEIAARDGEPIVRPMAYHAAGLDDVVDQFFFGPDIIVAPVLEKEARSRTVHLPSGAWMSSDGTVHHGPSQIEVSCTLRTVPRFRRMPA